jgi:hypothetical protein
MGEVVGAFAEMSFETFTMKVERGADLNLKFTTLEFLSPFMHITGTGGLTNPNSPAPRAGTRSSGPVLATTANATNATPIQNQPMNVVLQFGAKDHMAVLLNKAGVLSPNKDPAGYNLMTKSFTIKGTPANPDSSDLWSYLLSEVTSRGLPALDGLLNKRAR